MYKVIGVDRITRKSCHEIVELSDLQIRNISVSTARNISTLRLTSTDSDEAKPSPPPGCVICLNVICSDETVEPAFSENTFGKQNIWKSAGKIISQGKLAEMKTAAKAVNDSNERQRSDISVDVRLLKGAVGERLIFHNTPRTSPGVSDAKRFS